MAQVERQQEVQTILQNLRSLDGLKRLFWQELNYDHANKPLSPRQWPESAKHALADDPVLFASGGEDNAFHIIYCRLNSDTLQRGLERPIVNQLIREHPYCLFVFSDKGRSTWHFLNIKYDENAEKRRLFRRITVRAGGGLRTAAERLQMLDLAAMGVPTTSRRGVQNLTLPPAKPAGSGGKPLSPLEIQKRHDDAFDVESVTKAFYKELANWYFWALKHVRFPKDAPKEADGHDHIGVIRMITRLIFCWFVKEKGLIPEVLFDQRRLDELLDGFAPDKDAKKDSVFYKAILQNLFFATLNTEMDKRAWAREEQNFMAHSLYRHRDLFKKPGEALALFKNIPFLNGGLFECLDKDLGEGSRPRYVRIDGFSRRPDSQPVVPDFLFFGHEREEDLSAEYRDKKFRKVRMRGLIHTLRHYYFTIEENTPIEQEVALDPELSGKVFENLLAAYNPETGASARKQTGSFYTPREIVDYMVDEALLAFLGAALERSDASRRPCVAGSEISAPVTQGHREPASQRPRVAGGENACGQEADTPPNAPRLRRLISWEDSGHDFDGRETEALIAAIDGLKALDPAVGSGAFPMGILHKLVFILGKLDPRNEQWEQRQIQRVRDAIATAEKIEDAAIRDRTVKELEQQIVGIEDAFEHNELDYGRKLYLIENCLYGVDIQSIAVQIAKMRFFISLIVDQRVDLDAPNLGVRPLPNLETKFVAANTLIGIEKPKQMLLRNPQIDAKEAELRRVREKHFIARTLSSKAKCRDQDKRLRGEIAELLKSDGWGDTTAKQLAAWDPYDQNASAGFFDPEWMFGVRDGFDVVIGNPPYIFARNSVSKGLTDADKRYFYEHYELAEYQVNLYPLFIEKASGLLRATGCLSFITPNNWLTINTNRSVRKFVLQKSDITLVNFYARVFETADVDSAIVVFTNASCRQIVSLCEFTDSLHLIKRMNCDFFLKQKDHVINIEAFKCGGVAESLAQIEERSERLGDLADVKVGLGAYGIGRGKPPQTKDMIEKRVYHATHRASPQYYKYIDGRDVCRYWIGWSGEYLKYGEHLREPRNDFHLFSTKRILVRQIPSKPPYCINAGLAEETFLNDRNSMNIINMRESPELLLGIINSRLLSFWFVHKFGKLQRGTFPQFKVNELAAFPIATNRIMHKEKIVSIVTHILAAKRADPAADTSALEREIDRMVYEMYGLTEEEIGIVDGATGKEEK